tara:strand:- start:834 stop:1472 length:639 start_codon:yes stop_codon:yes gene_type:complete
MKNRNISFLIFLLLISGQLFSQSVFPGKSTIKKTDYFGLVLNQTIPEKQLAEYWENYLDTFGKAKGRRGVVTVDKASILRLSSKPVEIVSEVSSPNKGQSQVFIAVSVEGKFIENYNGQTYNVVESILKDFAENATAKNEVKIADDLFTEAEKNHEKLVKKNEDAKKEMDKAEKRIKELQNEIEQNNKEIENSLTDLKNKQRALEVQKSKIR